MTRKHMAIEILPRALWLIQGIVLYVFCRPMSGWPILKDNPGSLVAGFFLAFIGIVCLIWTFRFLAKPMFTKELTTTGPYGYVRHPMYVAMYLILIGLGLLFFQGTWFIILLLFIPLWYIDCKIEEGQMTDLWGEKYRSYQKQVGMFIPGL